MLKKIILTVLMSLLVSFPADAALLTLTQNGSLWTGTYSSTDSLTGDRVDVRDYSFMTIGSGVASDDVTVLGFPYATKPSGTLYNDEYAYAGTLGGWIEYTFAEGVSSFGLTWGTIDHGNTLTFYNGLNELASINGNGLVALAALAGLTITADGTSQVDVLITGLSDLITSVVMSAAVLPFEVANLTVSSVPLPASVVLFMTALFALAMFAAYRNRARA